jgi:glycerophosphoryl diester phosphodiesterase
VLDELDIADPAGVSVFGARPGDIGLGDPFSMPYQTIEALLPVATDRVVIVNDTNFGSTGRNPARADDSDFIEVRVPGLKRVRPRG